MEEKDVKNKSKLIRSAYALALIIIFIGAIISNSNEMLGKFIYYCGVLGFFILLMIFPTINSQIVKVLGENISKVIVRIVAFIMAICVVVSIII